MIGAAVFEIIYMTGILHMIIQVLPQKIEISKAIYCSIVFVIDLPRDFWGCDPID